MEHNDGNDTLHFRYVRLKVLTRIELPAFESDTASSVRAVGGEERIAEVVQLQQLPLQYNLAEGCIPSSVINAVPVNKNGLLVRIRRERSNPANTSCELIGAVPKSYIFNALADYKFVDNSPVQSTPYVLNTPPSTICKETVNKGVQRLILQENAKRTTSNKPFGAAGEAGNPADQAEVVDPINPEANPRNPDKGLACFININDPTPQHHPRGDYPYDNERGIVLVKLLKKLFSIIPVLSREQIETYINLEGRVHLFKSCLPYVAYSIVKGPFRGLWIRFGYDPKQHPESAIYQTIHFRVSPQVVKDVTERVGRKVGNTIGRSKMVDLDSLRVLDMPMNSVTYLLMNRPQDDPPIFVYNHVIKMQFIVQIYQLMDPSILQFLRHAPLLPTFDHTTGWFTIDTLNTLRAMALKALPDRINSFLALPDTVVWEQYHAKAGGNTDGGDARTHDALSALTGDFDLNEGANDFGFDQRSTGMFVDFNRTMNTVRAYLSREHAGFSGGSSSSKHSAGAGALTAEGAAALDPLHTADGINCGKCIAWLRPYYAAIRQAMASADLGPAVPPPPPLVASTAAPSATKPAKKFTAKPPGRPKSAAPVNKPTSSSNTAAAAVAMQAVATAAAARDASAFELLEDEGGSGSDGQEEDTSDSEADYYRV